MLVRGVMLEMLGRATGLAWLVLLLVAAPVGAQETSEPPGPPAAAGTNLGPLTAVMQALLGRFEWLPGAISDTSREMLRELLPAVWAQIVPDIPGITAWGALMFLGYVAQ